MKRNAGKKESRKNLELRAEMLREMQELRHELDYVRKHLDKLWEHATTGNQRIQELEIQMNLLGRLLTIICIEKLGLKLKSFKQLVRRIEKETVADLQVHHLEELYRLEAKRHHLEK